MKIVSRFLNLFRQPAEQSTGKAHGAVSPFITPEAKDTADMVRRMREDETVTFAECTLKACIKRIDVFVTTESTDPRAIALADSLQELWERALDDFMESIAYGRSAFEKIVDYDHVNNLRAPCKLDPIPYSLSEMVLSEGRFGGIIVGKGDSKITLEKAESLWVAIDTDALNPHGRSRFLGAPYRVWQRRQKAVGPNGLEEKFLARFALRGGKAHVEPVVTDEKTGQSVDNLAATAEAYQDLLTGGLMIFPNTPNADGTGFANDITESPSTLDPSPLMLVVDKLDIRMLRAFGIPEKTVIDNGAGSWDLVSLQMLILWAVCEGLLGQFVDAFQVGVIDPAIEENFIAATGTTIKATFTRPSQQPDSMMAEIAKALMIGGQLSPVVLSGGIDVRKILEAAGIPVTSDLESRLTAIFEQLQAAGAAPPPIPQYPAGSSGAISMANQQRNEIALTKDMPDVPSKEELMDAASEALAGLWSELTDAAVNGDEDAIRRLCAEINALHAQTQVAANIIGRMTPIKPHLQGVPTGNRIKQTPVRKVMANIPSTLITSNLGDPVAGESGPKWEFPFLNDAIKWLKNREIATSEELIQTTAGVRRVMFSSPAVNDTAVLAQVRDALTQSVAAGETPAQFHDRVKEFTSLTQAQTSTILRTDTKTAYIQGLDKTAKKPAVAAAFPYAMLAVTHDGRTRDSHWDARNTVVKVGTPEYDTIKRLLTDYNCRCALVLLTESQAKARGISTYENLPASVKSTYSTA